MDAERTTPTAGIAPHTTDPTFERLRAAWAVRLPPADAVEELALESLVAVQWRRWRLDAIEDRLLAALLKGETREGLPSLEAVCRYAGRLAKDLDLARERLNRLRRERPDRRPLGVAPREGADPASWPAAAEALAGAVWHEAPEPPLASAAEPDPGAHGEPDGQAPAEPAAAAPTVPPAGAAAIEAAVAELWADLVGGGAAGVGRAPPSTRTSLLGTAAGLAA